MEFITLGSFLWALVIVAGIMFVLGLWKRSWQSLVWSAAALLPPMLAIFLGGSGIWFWLCILPPLAILAVAYYLKRKKDMRVL